MAKETEENGGIIPTQPIPIHTSRRRKHANHTLQRATPDRIRNHHVQRSRTHNASAKKRQEELALGIFQKTNQEKTINRATQHKDEAEQSTTKTKTTQKSLSSNPNAGQAHKPKQNPTTINATTHTVINHRPTKEKTKNTKAKKKNQKKQHKTT